MKKLLRIAFLLPALFGMLPYYAISFPYNDDDNNVVIKSKTEKYTFAFGSAENPVIINESSNTVFRCDGYRTDLPYVEFYDDQSTINDVTVLIDGKKSKNIRPTFEYYSAENIFYSDAKVCYFQFPLEKKGSESEVQIN